MHSRVVHCKYQPYDVYIGRPSVWGNPFVIGRDGDRDEVIHKYKVWLLKQPGLVEDLIELRGKILGCWCAPGRCHGDVLAELSDLETKVAPCREPYVDGYLTDHVLDCSRCLSLWERSLKISP